MKRLQTNVVRAGGLSILVAVAAGGCAAAHRPVGSPAPATTAATPTPTPANPLAAATSEREGWLLQCEYARAHPTPRPVPTGTPRPSPDAYEDLDAILYQQLAAEYRANATNVYRSAATALHGLVAAARAEEAREAPRAGREPREPVVVLDLDETVFDNSLQQGRLVAEGRVYDERLWDCWVGLKKAEPVPGAKLLFREMVKERVRARFITNRKCERRYQDECPQKAETLENLNALLADTGYVATADELLLSNDSIPDGDGRWKSEKKPRRDFVEKTHVIAMLVGDDFGDFLDGVRSASTEARNTALATTMDRWGSNWFILPNPSYGSWLNVLPKGQHEALVKTFDYPTK